MIHGKADAIQGIESQWGMTSIKERNVLRFAGRSVVRVVKERHLFYSGGPAKSNHFIARDSAPPLAQNTRWRILHRMNDIKRQDGSSGLERTVGKNRRGKRYVQIIFLVTPEEKAELQEEANRRGLNMSGLVRAALSFFRERV